MAKKREESKREKIELRLEHQFPEEFSLASFANHMVVQKDEHDFHISFFQITPPLIVGTESERREQAEKLQSIPAKCVARIVVAEGYLPRVIAALQAHLERTAKAAESELDNGRGKSHDKTA